MSILHIAGKKEKIRRQEMVSDWKIRIKCLGSMFGAQERGGMR